MPHLRTAALAALLLAGAAGPGHLAAQEPGSELRVWLVTADAGDAVWERFGHNALRILDASSGRDVAYNWGIFDFQQPGFVPRFLKGEMLYMMAGFWTGPMVESYTGAGRDVVLQELSLTPAQKVALRDFLEWNSLPENRDYRYDYFRDNCSTRVRDALDRVLGGELARRYAEAPTGRSYRWHIRRLTRMDPFLYTGMDVLLGAPGDRPITVWEEMFLPMTLRDAVREVTVVGDDGTEHPLVVDEVRTGPGTRPADPEAPPRWLPWYLVLGALLGGVLAWTGRRGAAGTRWAARAFGAVASAWSLLAGLVGTLLVLVLLTDHVFMAWNANLLLASPLSLALAVLAPLAAGKPARRRGASRLAAVALGLAALGAGVSLAAAVLPGPGQDNAIFLALALPAHAGLWWGVRALARAG